jgi:HK97 family phage prohead protease
MAQVTVIVGPPCAGKSTYVHDHAAPGDVVIDFDTLAAALGSPTRHGPPAPIAGVAAAARAAAVKKVLKGIPADAWIVHASPTTSDLTAYASANAEVVVLDPGLGQCLARAESDGRPHGTDDAIRAWYDSPPHIPDRKKKGTGMSEIRRKSVPAQIKSTDDATGKVQALVAVFNNVDHGGDRILKGAFEGTLEEWKKSGDPIPVIFNHEWGDLWSHIGVVDDITETEDGLLASYTLDVKDNPAAAQVYKLMKRRSLKEHSFAYGIPKGGSAMTDAGVNELRELELFEVGPTLKGMNPDTELLSVKSALEQANRQHIVEQAAKGMQYMAKATTDADGAVTTAEKVAAGDPAAEAETGEKAGRTLSKANERKLRTAMESIASVLSSLESQTEENPEKSSVNEDETNTKDGQEAGVGGGKSSGLDVELLSFLARIDQLKETS